MSPTESTPENALVLLNIPLFQRHRTERVYYSGGEPCCLKDIDIEKGCDSWVGM